MLYWDVYVLKRIKFVLFHISKESFIEWTGIMNLLLRKRDSWYCGYRTFANVLQFFLVRWELSWKCNNVLGGTKRIWERRKRYFSICYGQPKINQDWLTWVLTICPRLLNLWSFTLKKEMYSQTSKTDFASEVSGKRQASGRSLPRKLLLFWWVWITGISLTNARAMWRDRR